MPTSQQQAANGATSSLKVVEKMSKTSSPKAQSAAQTSAFSKAELQHWYHQMLFMRRFEEKAASLYQQKEIQGFCHLYIGQEAVAAGAKAASIEGDDFITSYRCHALALICGLTGEEVMGELTGREIGISKGKGGSMHMFEPAKHFWGGHGIVAAQVPLGAGLAFASKYRNDVMNQPNKNVSFTFMGDGSVNAGQVFESFNMAALWKLPVVFVIENNQWGMGTSVPRAAAGELHRRGEPFGIPGEKVDGMDFLASTEAFQRAAAWCREGKGPYLLELDTYRYRGHSMSDPAKYRTREDVDAVKEQRDPITRLQKHMMTEFGMTEAEFEAVDDAIKAEVNKIAEIATTAPRPTAAELFTDVVPE
ncbi:MAG: pyruvate dehydrogenase (acetyl-transferring) E1 component subunit alpha [Blastochloris viridis]|uniref:Pyruvate dehydrogenase E1 component subunit alpha n=1 Tax=Blastochloris viridis TaxID=1079 RepID=A0A6N4RF01_BLAVI|nr:MAG: pyruvate dehydrogenase (acetyl-transferring) E1 component subunit alpha [Blastochloris viridis]